MLEEVELTKLIFDPINQPRVSMDTAYVEEWAERYRDPSFEGPAIIVYYDEDTDEYWVADGFCRGTGAKAANRKTIVLMDLPARESPRRVEVQPRGERHARDARTRRGSPEARSPPPSRTPSSSLGRTTASPKI